MGETVHVLIPQGADVAELICAIDHLKKARCTIHIYKQADYNRNEYIWQTVIFPTAEELLNDISKEIEKALESGKHSDALYFMRGQIMGYESTCGRKVE